MKLSFDLFGEPTPAPLAAPFAAAPLSSPELEPRPASALRLPGRTLHPTVAAAESHLLGAPKSRVELRGDLQAANVATVRFDVQAGELVRISQFIPAGNQCIGLYPGALQAAGRDMVAALQVDSGVIEWDVAGDRPTCLAAPGADVDQADQAEHEPEGPRP